MKKILGQCVMRIARHSLAVIPLMSCLLAIENAHAASWLDGIAGNYYGGRDTCRIELRQIDPRLGTRRCTCLSIKKLTDTTASIEFDRHDFPDGNACAGTGIAHVVGKMLVLCPAEEVNRPDGCVKIKERNGTLEFHSDEYEAYCGLRKTLNGLRFLPKDRVEREVYCGP